MTNDCPGDPFGNSVAKTAHCVTTCDLVEDDVNLTGYRQVFAELNGAGAVTRTYAYGLQRISQNQPINNTWTVSFYGYDGGGNVRQLTSAAGSVTDSYEYDAFGSEFTTSGTTPNNYLYRGEQYDPDLGLYYLRARYYNPLTGRFLSRDPDDHSPTDPKSLHKYLYADGDPMNIIDPSGRGLVETVITFAKRTVKAVFEGTRLGEAALCFLKFTSDLVNVAAVGFYNANPIDVNIGLLWGEFQDCLELVSIYYL